MPETHFKTPIRDLLNPRSVAVIGASEDQSKLGGRLYKTLLQHRYAGTVYPINPARDRLFGIPAFPSVRALPDAPDVVVIAVPRGKVKEEVAACAARGAKAGIIITSKFSDAGPEGRALEEEIVAVAHEGGMRLMGPNCLGLISPANRVVLCSSPALDVEALIKAPIGFISQSGALMGTLFDRAHGMGIGFSHCVSVGNQADLEANDFVEFLIEDDHTQVICSYVEGIKSPDRFAELARRARAAGKPWLMVKAGTTADGSRAAFSHTASLAGDFAALKALCERENVVLMDDPLDMLSLARAMVRYPNRRVRRVGVITTSGGGGAITADRLAHTGIGLAWFGDATRQALAEYYAEGQAGNPIDIGGRKNDANPDLGAITAELMLADPDVDLGLMVLTTAPDVPGLTRKLVEGAVRPAAQGKPTLYVMLPGRVAETARRTLVEHRLPYVDTLAEAIAVLRGWQAWSIYQAPDEPERPSDMAPTVVPAAGTLDEAASKALLHAAGIPVNQARIVRDADEAVAAAEVLGYPARAQGGLARHRAQVRRGRGDAGHRRRGAAAPGTGGHAGARGPGAPHGAHRRLFAAAAGGRSARADRGRSLRRAVRSAGPRRCRRRARGAARGCGPAAGAGGPCQRLPRCAAARGRSAAGGMARAARAGRRRAGRRHRAHGLAGGRPACRRLARLRDRGQSTQAARARPGRGGRRRPRAYRPGLRLDDRRAARLSWGMGPRAQRLPAVAARSAGPSAKHGPMARARPPSPAQGPWPWRRLA
jgi:acyl-CoA synthetase (NDP forming)